MSKESRRRYTAEKKASILRKHFVEKVPVSDICDEFKIQPSLFYSWQRQMMENLEASLQDGRSRSNGGVDRRVADLEEKVAKKDAVIAKKESVIAEVTEEYVTLKKTLGES